MKRKYIFVTGGVLSSLGKGIVASSIAKLVKHKTSAKASLMKIDPYLNCDAGTLNPFEHGEVFVTRDGYECDLDLGNYERFLNDFAIKEQNLMMGQIYRNLVEKERRGTYLGKTVQLIPHATNEIKEKIKLCGEKTQCDILVIEIGGTVGDIESEIVLEAARQMKYEEGENVLFVHLALLPKILTGEEKTKPMQHSVRALHARGISPDFLIGRTVKQMEKNSKTKLALQCNVNEESIYCSPNLTSVYKLPLVLEEQEMDQAIIAKLKLQNHGEGLNELKQLIEKMENLNDTINIAVVGKYAYSNDAYASVFESLIHAGVHNDVKVNSTLVDSTQVEDEKIKLKDFNGFVIPGGFGARGVEGKIKTIQHARENNAPLLGICYGFQLSIVEIARNVLNLKDANSTEINEKTLYPVIDLLPEQKKIRDKGATMRLGVQETIVKKGTTAFKIYKQEKILKRFRHRWEMNPKYVEKMQDAGIVFSGENTGHTIKKILELKDHAFFFGTQFHPEFDSRLEKPEEAFYQLVRESKC